MTSATAILAEDFVTPTSDSFETTKPELVSKIHDVRSTIMIISEFAPYKLKIRFTMRQYSLDLLNLFVIRLLNPVNGDDLTAELHRYVSKFPFIEVPL